MEKMFLYNENKVRTQTDKNGEFWFAGIDLCNILEYADSHQAIMGLDEDERNLDRMTDGSGQKRKIWTVNEPGMWSLVLSSTKPEAKAFKRWITHDVLPALRKAGIYSTDALNRKNIVIQDLIEKIELKDIAITKRESEVKKLKKEKAQLQTELMQVLKTDPNQTNVYPDEIWDGIKKQMENHK